MYFNHIACRDCTIRSQCTKAKREPRRMRRWVHEEIVEKMQQRLEAAPETTVIRKQTVEHPFGTIKMWMGTTHFLMKRLHNVKTEMSLHVLAYNMKRMISIFGAVNLITRIRGYSPLFQFLKIQSIHNDREKWFENSVKIIIRNQSHFLLFQS